MSKRRAVPAAINQAAPEPTLPERIRTVADQLIRRAAATGPDLELGGIGLALAMVANDADKELAKLTLQRDLAVAHDQQPYPTAWAYEQACKAARKHHDRAEAAEAAADRVRAPCADWAKPTTSATRDGRIRDEVAATCADIILRALDGPSPTPDDSAPLLEQTCATFSDHGWGRCVEPDGHEGNHAYRSPSKPTDGSPA